MGYTITPLPAPTSGLSTARPASATPGAFYFETDTKKTMQWSGIGWVFHSIVPDPDWIAVVFVNGWGNYSPAASGFTNAAYRRLSSGLVVIRGLIVGPANAPVSQTMFTLPTGYRPNRNVLVTTTAADQWARFDILPTGEVQWIRGGTAASNSYVSVATDFFPDQ